MTNEVDYNPCQYLGNGQTRDFSFNWKVLKTSELIVKIINLVGIETTLNFGSDYTVKIESVGGNVTLASAPLIGEKIIISRNTTIYQGTGYSTSTGFQGSEIEKSFDKVSLNLQELYYNNELFKSNVSEEARALINDYKTEIDSEITNFTTTIDNQISSFTNSVNTTIQANQSANESSIQNFKDSINKTLATVIEAAEKVNSLDETVEAVQRVGALLNDFYTSGISGGNALNVYDSEKSISGGTAASSGIKILYGGNAFTTGSIVGDLIENVRTLRSGVSFALSEIGKYHNVNYFN